jgi:hypothetical protein
MYLKSLSVYQQRAEIGRLAFSRICTSSSLEENLLKDQAVSAFSKTLGVNPSSWKCDLKHSAEEPDLIGIPVFRSEQCTAPFSFRYEYLSHNLVIMGTIYMYDDGSAIVGTLACHTCLFNQSRALGRLVLAGINPDTLETVGHNLEMSRNIPYLDYLKALLPQQRRDAIFYLAERAWGTDNPKFLDHPKLAPELEELGISDLSACWYIHHEVGPVEFNGGRCTAPLTYHLGVEGELSKYDEGGSGYYVGVHILVAIGNKPLGGGDTSIENIWFRIESIDDLEDRAIPIVP